MYQWRDLNPHAEAAVSKTAKSTIPSHWLILCAVGFEPTTLWPQTIYSTAELRTVDWLNSFCAYLSEFVFSFLFSPLIYTAKVLTLLKFKKLFNRLTFLVCLFFVLSTRKFILAPLFISCEFIHATLLC